MSLTKRAAEIHHRAVLLARSTIPAAMRLVADAGLTSRPLAGGLELVADRFEFVPAIGYWRSVDGKYRGYDVHSLIKAARA